MLDSTSPSPISLLYERDPATYAIIANDRDFTLQTQLLLEYLPPGQHRVLELFAGPAFHAIEICKRKGAEAVCMDVSAAMKAEAVERGFAPESLYHVGLIPSAIQDVAFRRPYDCVLILRFSLGYLMPQEVDHLLTVLRPILAQGAKIYVELHELENIVGNLNRIEIRDRTVDLENGQRIRCVWPDGPVLWDRDDWIATMKVRFEWREGAVTTRRSEYFSKEWIHTFGSLKRTVDRLGRYEIFHVEDCIADAFQGAKLVVLEAK